MENNIERIYRHGDVIIYKLKQWPGQITKETPLNTLTLALGEVTGHKHVLTGQLANIELHNNHADEEDLEEGSTYFRVTDGNALLRHEEHKTLVLDVGYYLKVDQVEYNPFAQLLQRITD